MLSRSLLLQANRIILGLVVSIMVAMGVTKRLKRGYPVLKHGLSLYIATTILHYSTACTIATSIVHSKLDYCNSLYYKLTKSQLSRLQSSRSRTLLLVLSWKLPSHVISLLSYAVFTGSGSLNASNTSSSHLPTKFSSHNYPTSIPS